MSDSVQPHRLQPTRLLPPWDSPGKSGLPFPSPMHESESESEDAQSCPTLSDPMDCSLPGFSIHGIFQARVLEWGAIAFSESELYHLLNRWCWANSLTPLIPSFLNSNADNYYYYIIIINSCNAGDPGSIPRSGRSHGEGNGNPLQYSCLENPMDGEKPGGLQSMGSQIVGHDWVTSTHNETPKFHWNETPNETPNSMKHFIYIRTWRIHLWRWNKLEILFVL